MAGILKHLHELLDAGIIDNETAGRIRKYYEEKRSSGSSRLFLIFGIFGALLIGLGTILIIAHNWDHFSRAVKTIIAFAPLVLSQLVCLFALIKRPDSRAWPEAGAVLLFLSIGASISLISQIYHIPGDLSQYLLTWMLLALPLIYLMKSPMSSLLYLTGITAYAVESNYGFLESSHTYWYWLLAAAVLPFYVMRILKYPKSNFTGFLHWFIALSLTISLGTLARENEHFMYLAYFLLFGVLQTFGFWLHHRNMPAYNGMRIIGALGTIITLLILSFHDVWYEIMSGKDHGWMGSELWSCTVLVIVFVYLYFRTRKEAVEAATSIPFWVYLSGVAIFFTGMVWDQAYILINILILAIGVLKIRDGVSSDDLVILNFGMLIIAALTASRFFDTDLSFVVRGLLFVLVGAGFFAANYVLLKKRGHA